MQLGKNSFGVGDRFGCEGKAQLQAFIIAKDYGVDIVPVWNKSHREHSIIGTRPSDVRMEADKAVDDLKFNSPYFVDADHINLSNLDLFMDSSDFFTLDVADTIGLDCDEDVVEDFLSKFDKYTGQLQIPGIDEVFNLDRVELKAIANKYLKAIDQAASLYRHIESAKGTDNFITEISMDETDTPQSPVELFFILAAVSDRQIPVQTIAPKFTGSFLKGIDYIGDVEQFAKEFEQDLAVIAFAVEVFGLPSNLKLSIHSGSDKFSLYKYIRKALKKYDAGLHIKTAGTTWLEELAGLALAGEEGLSIAKRIYEEAFSRFDELCKPYATVVNIEREKLPAPEKVNEWSGDDFIKALRHNQDCSQYDVNVRQLLHLAYKVAAEMGAQFTGALEKYREFIAPGVTENIYQRHIKPLFIEQD